MRYPHKHSCRYVWGSYVWVQTHHSNVGFQSISTQAFFPSVAETEFIVRMKFCFWLKPYAENGTVSNLCKIHKSKSKRNPIRQNTNILNWIKGQENFFKIFISVGVFKKHQITKKSQPSSCSKEPAIICSFSSYLILNFIISYVMFFLNRLLLQFTLWNEQREIKSYRRQDEWNCPHSLLPFHTLFICWTQQQLSFHLKS